MKRMVTVERLFGVSQKRAFAAYWDLHLWPTILPNVVEVNVYYDDGIHQDFAMTVNNEGVRETIRGARIGVPNRKLELCQFVTPPGFLMMRGEWRFERSEATSDVATKVFAERIFDLRDPSLEDEVASKLKTLLAKNLEAFDSYLSAE